MTRLHGRSAAARHRLIWLVQGISLARLLATILFVTLASRNIPRFVVAGLLIFAIASDYADGYLSRKLKAQTHFGKVLDLVADKSLTGVSLLYAAAQGIDIIPLAVIATRDMLMLGLRLVISEGQQLLPTNRMFGGLMAVLVWGNTLFLVLIPSDSPMVNIATLLYWAAATFFGFNLAMRIRSSWERIKATSTDQELPSLPK